MTLTGTVFGSTATYTCNDGFRLEGEETRKCEATALWSGEAPTCVRKFHNIIGAFLHEYCSFAGPTKCMGGYLHE